MSAVRLTAWRTSCTTPELCGAFCLGWLFCTLFDGDFAWFASVAGGVVCWQPVSNNKKGPIVLCKAICKFSRGRITCLRLFERVSMGSNQSRHFTLLTAANVLLQLGAELGNGILNRPACAV